MRYVVGVSYDWGDELVQAMIVTGMVLAGAGAARQGKHTTILKGRKRVVLLIIQDVISILGCGVMVWAGIEIIIILKDEALASTSSIPIPFWLLYAMLPISLLFCGIYYLEKMVREIVQLRSGEVNNESG